MIQKITIEGNHNVTNFKLKQNIYLYTVKLEMFAND